MPCTMMFDDYDFDTLPASLSLDYATGMDTAKPLSSGSRHGHGADKDGYLNFDDVLIAKERLKGHIKLTVRLPFL